MLCACPMPEPAGDAAARGWRGSDGGSAAPKVDRGVGKLPVWRCRRNMYSSACIKPSFGVLENTKFLIKPCQTLGFCDAGCLAGFSQGSFPAGHIWSVLVVAVVETQHGPFKQALCDLAWGLHSSEQIKASSPLPGERSVPVPCVNRGKEIRTAEGFGS